MRLKKWISSAIHPKAEALGFLAHIRNGSNGRVRRFYESLMKLDGVELDRIVDEVVNV